MSESDWWQLHRKLPALHQRAAIIQKIRNWFIEREFLEVETPILASSPGLEVHLQAMETRVSARQRFLITSPEYHMKRLLCAGAERIYYLGKAFRDDERGALHLPEFTMLEWYRTHEEPSQLMNDVRDLVELATGVPRQWTTITVNDALERWGTPTKDPDQIIQQLVTQVEPELASLGAVFLTEYPASLASLARINANNPNVSDRFEAYVDGVELANGFGELADATEQRERFQKDLAQRRALGRPCYPIDERFLAALNRGMPPASGIALGIDRLVMLALGAKSVDEIIAFTPEVA